jgi:hypothetical protein
MKTLASVNVRHGFTHTVGFFIFVGLQLAACKKQAQESIVTESAALNGGFRIPPTQAARDGMRPKVIYRCNAVNCGEPFQPSNEEREIVIPCDLDKLNFPAGVLPPYYRTVAERGVLQLTVNVQHQAMCKDPQPFQSVLASDPADSGKESSVSSTGCQKFRASKELCTGIEAEGCQWVTHPSGRNSMGRTGDCVGMLNGASAVSGVETLQSFQVDKSPVQWAPLETYRSAP